MTIAIIWTVALILIAVSFWIRRRRRLRRAFTTASGSVVRLANVAAMPNASKMLVYVNDDGSVRELTEADKRYVDTEFSPLDGARPYIKSYYSQRTPLGEIRGYLPRSEVPEGVPILPAPPETEPRQQTPQAVAEDISELIRKRTRV
jgi:hypothetical protein